MHFEKKDDERGGILYCGGSDFADCIFKGAS